MLQTFKDYFGLTSQAGIEIQSNSENKTRGYVAEARGPDGFLVAVDAAGELEAPACSYIITKDISLSSIKLGAIHTYNTKPYMLGNVTFSTTAGSAPTLEASGNEVETGATEGCTCTLNNVLSIDHLYHAQDFGLFTITNGQLQDSTLTIEGEVGTAQIDGVVKSSDLVGASITITGNVLGVTDNGLTSVPTLTPRSDLTALPNVVSVVITQPLSETRNNGEFSTYSFELQAGLRSDQTLSNS